MLRPIVAWRPRRQWQWALISALVLVIGTGSYFFVIRPLLAASDSITISTQADWEAGEYYPGSLDTKTSVGDLQMQSGSVGTWDPGTPGYTYDNAGYDFWTWDGASYGSAMATDGSYVYIILGNRKPYLFRLNPETNTWKQMANAPTAFYYGSSLTYDGDGHLFAISGGDGTEATNINNATKHMFKYDIATDTWSKVSDAPDIWTLGSSIASDHNGKIYAIRAYYNSGLPDAFWVYNTTNDSWNSTLPTAQTNISSTNGQPIIFVNQPYNGNCTLGCIYLLNGGNAKGFNRYDIAENQWYAMSNTAVNVGYGSGMAYDPVNGYIYTHVGNQQTTFAKFDVANETWLTADDSPGNVYYGGANAYIAVNGTGYIYQLRGYNTPDLWRFDATAGHWESVATPTTAFQFGNAGSDGLISYVPDLGSGQCTDASGCLFVFRGNNSTTFWRYNIGAKTWTTNLTVTNLGALNNGSSVCKTSNTLYALRANNTVNFYSYNLTSADPGSAWTVLTSMPTTSGASGAYPATATNANYGASIACLGSDVYALKGNNSNHFFKYSGSSWSSLTVAPQRTYSGAGIVAVPNGSYCADSGGCIFALMGSQRGDWYRYDITANTWTQLADLPTATNYTAALTYDAAGHIFVISGNYTQKMWRYDITGNTWSRIVDVPGKAGYNTGMDYDSADGTIYAMAGMSTGQIWHYTPTANQYNASATWISATQDLNDVQAWEQLTGTMSTPGTSTIDVAMRSSDNRADWSSWDTLTSGASGSSLNVNISGATTPTNRYIQLRVIFHSDGTNSPTINDVTVSYTKDSSAPSNPTASGWSSFAKTATLTSGSSDGYHFTNPYFELSGASDGSGSGIAGYYVAWTTTSGLDPSSSSDYFQTNTSYTVNTDMVTSSPGPTYYLRVATKDNAGNISSPTTAFTYTYAGIAATSLTTWSTQADFEQTGTTASNINTTANSGTDTTLASVSPGTWMDLPTIGGNNSLTGYNSYNDSSLAWDGDDTIYYLRSVNSQTFLKYTISTKTWSALANTGANAYTGAAIVYIPPSITSGCSDAQGCVIAMLGNGTGFRRYNIGANTWTTLSATWNTVGYGAGLIYTGGDYIFVTRGNNSSDVYRYTISTDTWTSRASFEYNFYYGASYAYVPHGTWCTDAQGCIFATRGAGTNQFMRYDISDNSWSYLTAVATASPSKTNYGASMVFNNGYLYYIGGYASTDFLQYDITNDFWTTLADMPATHYYGSTNAMVYDTSTDTIYTPRSYNTQDFLSYDVTKNTWRNPALPHGLSSNGFNSGGIAYDSSDTLYIARGTNTNDFYSYRVSTQAWTKLADVPTRMNTGADVLYISGSVYALTGTPSNGESSSRFYRYNPTTDFWTRLEDTPASVNNGATLVWDGQDTIYTGRGGNTNTWYSYSIASGHWSTQASNVTGTLNNGSCAVADPTNNYIYMIRANNSSSLYRCTMNKGAGTCTWDTTLTSAPNNIIYSGSCTLNNGNIFVPRGNSGITDFYVYNISGNSWSTRTLNDYFRNGRLVTGPNDVLYGLRGSYASNLERYVQQTSTTSFERVGTWTSQILDLGSVYGYGNVQVSSSLQANTTLKYETRSCSDAACASDESNGAWSEWATATNQHTVGGTEYYTVNSTVARYAQIRVTYTSDRIYTPTLHDISLSYYVDGTAPNNPSSPISAYTDNGKGTSITNDTWTNTLTPYFEWTSTDNTGGIGIEGYYVYFGTDITKDPVTDANDPTNLAYTSGTNFYSATAAGVGSWNASTQSAAALTDGVYYLRIKTKDYNNNVTSSAVDAFTYKVDGSVPNNITDLSVTQYMLSTDTFQFTWSTVNDAGPSGISQYCYHTGSSSDTCVAPNTICSGGQCTLDNVAHYQTRVNNFFVRAKDEAGNYSSSYASTGYFYTGGPPTAPQSVTVTPGSQVDTNSFAVSWTKPATCLGQTPCSASDILQYCYTINEAPSDATCGTNTGGNPTPSVDGGWTTSSQTAALSLPAFSAANQQGTNTIYVVAKDAVGNIDYNNYTSQTYTFTSNAPGMPENMSILDSSDRASNRYSLTLTWDAPTDVGSGVEAYKIYRCTSSCDNPDTVDDPPANYTAIASVGTLGYLDTSLSNTTTYSYMVRATGTGGTISGNSAVVSLKPEGKFKSPPAMSGQPTVSAHIRSADISWLTQDDVDQHGNTVPHPASSFIKFGTTTGYENGETGTSDLVNEHSVTLLNLSPNTTYHFQLKWVDVDGNVGLSSDYTFTTLGAPSAPTNVSVTPTSGTSNSFAFSWDAPNDEGVTIGGYFYSVNSTPTADNTKFTTSASIAAYDAATRQGTNTFYVVAEDDGGNVNYSNYASVDFVAHTTPPGSPQSVTITDSSNRDQKRYSITLTWDPPSNIGNGSVNYTIKRSTDDGSTYSSIATITSTGYLDTGLSNTTKYTYQVYASDSAQATSDPTPAVSKTPEGRYTSPPPITSGPTASPDSFSAVINWETGRNASSFVDFGLSADTLTEEQGTADLITQHEVKITGLKASTTYYYQIKSIDVDQNEATSTVGTLTTLEAPRVLNVNVTNVRLNDAIISWQVNKEATAVINYGTDTNYGLTFTADASNYSLQHTVQMKNLSDGTTYHFRLGGEDRNGNPITSDDYVFTTLTFPQISDVTTKNKSQGQTEVSWKTNVPTSSSVLYYGDSIAPKTQGNDSLVTEHTVLLFGLNDDTAYKFKAQGADQFGYQAESPELTFTTLKDTTPPEVFGVKSESNTIGSGETSKIQIVVSWKTNEASSSQVEYGEGISSTTFTDATQENQELVLDHLVVISDLAQAKTYHFRVVSKDKAGNATKSGSNTVLTTQKQQSFIQLIVANLEQTFSWIGNIGK